MTPKIPDRRVVVSGYGLTPIMTPHRPYTKHVYSVGREMENFGSPHIFAIRYPSLTVVLEGVHRLWACEKRKVKPHFTFLDPTERLSQTVYDEMMEQGLYSFLAYELRDLITRMESVGDPKEHVYVEHQFRAPTDIRAAELLGSFFARMDDPKVELCHDEHNNIYSIHYMQIHGSRPVAEHTQRKKRITEMMNEAEGDPAAEGNLETC